MISAAIPQFIVNSIKIPQFNMFRNRSYTGFQPLLSSLHRSTAMEKPLTCYISKPILSANIDDNCAICLDSLPSDEHARLIPCKHAQFHEACIRTWFEMSILGTCCPLCREATEVYQLVDGTIWGLVDEDDVCGCGIVHEECEDCGKRHCKDSDWCWESESESESEERMEGTMVWSLGRRPTVVQGETHVAYVAELIEVNEAEDYYSVEDVLVDAVV